MCCLSIGKSLRSISKEVRPRRESVFGEPFYVAMNLMSYRMKDTSI
jgi:hypothetical protein